MTTLREPWIAFVALSLSCSNTSVRKVEPATPDPEAAISIEVYADGRDADQPPGARITEGETVLWTYVAVNSGALELTEVNVTDDIWGAIACSKTAINPGEQVVCTLERVPDAGLFVNVGTATGTTADGEIVRDTDSSYVLVDAIAALEPGEVQPAVCDTHLVMANPTQDSLTVVELASRTVSTVPVGDEPIDLAIDDACTMAVTLNHRAGTVSVIQLDGGAVAELEVRPGRNRLDVSPDGRWVLAWADPAHEGLGCVGGSCPVGELSVIDLQTSTVDDFATGVTPMDLSFVADSSRAVLAGDLQLAVIGLAAGAVQIDHPDLDPGTIAEVVVAGDYAWIRKQDATPVEVVDLAALTSDTFDLAAVPTDLVATEAAVFVVYDATVVTMSTTDPLSAPAVQVLPATGGTSLTMTGVGDAGLLYADASDQILWWTRPDQSAVARLVKPIRAVELSDTDALVIHTLADVAGVDDELTDRWVVSVVDVSDDALPANAITVSSRPTSWAISPGGHFAVVGTEGSGEVLVVDLATSLADFVSVAEPVRFVGFLPSSGAAAEEMAWVSHAHGLTWVSPSAKTVEVVAP